MHCILFLSRFGKIGKKSTDYCTHNYLLGKEESMTDDEGKVKNEIK